ncbi:Na+/solute symporter [Rhodotorula sp. JG-1b]|nr:Na+/solute symporter [Rhodotorula sp. JG-1b]
MAKSTAILSQGVGYGVVLGLGLFFTALMVLITKLQTRYTKFKVTSLAEFSSASHSVKPALISWTWAATLLQSSAMGFKVGLCGPYAYAAGATVQVLLFSMNAAKIKVNAPRAQTFLEVIRARWGRVPHIIFTCYALITSLLVSSMLVTGGAAVVTDLTDANQYAISMIISLPVAIYTLVGGLRSSLLADYIHTCALFAIILTFQFTVYATSDKIGSPSRMYDLLVQAGKDWPVEGNKDGSYLTFQSRTGMIFMVINLIGNFGTVFCDQAYWQRAIASVPSTAVKGYMIGGSAWLSVPLGMAATMGLSSVVLKYDPTYPNYPEGLSPSEVAAGLPAAAAAQVLLKEGGAALLLILLPWRSQLPSLRSANREAFWLILPIFLAQFLAVTSSAAAELCATSTIFANDIWLAYIRPHASEKEVLRVDHAAIVGWALVMGVAGCIFTAIGLSMGWLYMFMGVVIGAGVVPIALAIMSSRANRYACAGGAVFGTSSALVGWLVATATLNNGTISLETTIQDYPMLIGNLLSFCLSGLTAIIGSLIWPENYDWAETRALHAHPPATVEEVPAEMVEGEKDADDTKDKTQIVQTPLGGRSVAPSLKDTGMDLELEPPVSVHEDSPEEIEKTFRFACWVASSAFVILLILIPVPLAASGYISTKVGFVFYVVVSIIWVFYGATAVCIMPIWEYRHSLAEIGGNIWADVTKRKRVAQ